jgi:hypothetical protein
MSLEGLVDYRKIAMELTQEQRAKIEEIASGLKCSKDFKCFKSDFERMCKGVDMGFESLLECVEDDGALCRFSHLANNIRLCTCQLRIYIANYLNK